MSVWMAIASFLSSKVGAGILTLAIGVAGAYWLRQFHRSIASVWELLIRGLTVLRQDAETPFSQRLDALADDLSEIPIIGELWTQYHREYIHVDEEGNAYSLAPPGVVFHRDALLASRVNLRWFSAVPGILTGLGLLGTFIGLVAGLYVAEAGLTSQETSDMVASLRHLLGGASTAFWTSIVGLAGSICFNGYVRWRLHQIDGKILELNEYLYHNLPVRTVETILARTHGELVKQTDAIRQFSTELVVTIGQVFERTMANNVVPKLNELIDAVHILSSNQSELNQEQLASLAGRFEEVLMGTTSQRMSELASMLEALASRLNETTSALTTGDEVIRRGLAEVAATLQGSIAAAGSALRTQSDAMRKEIEETVRSIAAQVQEIKTQMVAGTEIFENRVRSAAGEFSAALQDQAQTFNSTVERLTAAGQTISQALQLGIQSLEEVLAKVQHSNQELARTIEQLRAVPQQWQRMLAQTSAATDRVSAVGQQLAALAGEHQRLTEALRQVASRLDEHAVTVTKVWQEQRERFEAIDRSLAEAFHSYERGLEGFSQKTREYIEDLDKSLKNAVNHLSGAIDELRDLFEEEEPHHAQPSLGKPYSRRRT